MPRKHKHKRGQQANEPATAQVYNNITPTPYTPHLGNLPDDAGPHLDVNQWYPYGFNPYTIPMPYAYPGMYYFDPGWVFAGPQNYLEYEEVEEIEDGVEHQEQAAPATPLQEPTKYVGVLVH
jgi:hypothetical protein